MIKEGEEINYTISHVSASEVKMIANMYLDCKEKLGGDSESFKMLRAVLSAAYGRKNHQLLQDIIDQVREDEFQKAWQREMRRLEAEHDAR